MVNERSAEPWPFPFPAVQRRKSAVICPKSNAAPWLSALEYWALRRDGLEQLVRIVPQHRQLVVQRGIEHAVGPLLVGEDPFLLAPADAGPHGEGLLRRGRAELIVPHDAPQQTHIRRADAVVVIQVDAGQGADENTVDDAVIDALHQRGI